MAELIQCPTCKGEFSSRAFKCPHCVEPRPCLRDGTHYFLIVTGLLLFAVSLVLLLAGGNAFCLLPLLRAARCSDAVLHGRICPGGWRNR